MKATPNGYAAGQSPDDIYPVFALIENRIRSGDKEGADFFARYAVSKFPITHITRRLNKSFQDFRSATVSLELIKPFSKNVFQDSAKEIATEDH